MVLLTDLFPDLGKLQDAIADGYVTRRDNYPHGNLAILNYAPKAQYENRWDEITTQCRGLIYNIDTHEIVARPFPKFFNWDQGAVKYPPPGPVLRMPKMDGSLGILYPIYETRWNGGNPDKFVVEYRMATRGSMNSEQAAWATKKFQEMTEFDGDNFGFAPEPGKTYLFEIIYPENRIVVNYGSQERLTLLDVIDNETGFSDVSEFESCYWTDKVERVLLPGFDSGQVVDIPPGEEGFVYLWPTRNFRTKMKAAEYIELHRIIFNLTPKNIWRAMLAGKTLDQIKEPFPDEFYDEIDDIWNIIESDINDLRSDVIDAYMRVTAAIGHDFSDRKRFAQAVKKHCPRELQGFMFNILDGKTEAVGASLMRMVEPKGDKPREEE